MSSSWKQTILYMLICLVAIPAGAYNLRQISKSDGLSNSAVLSLLQDKGGTIWLGTCDGVDIYDGITAHPWNEQGKPEFSGYLIEDILETDDHTIWVHTNYGLAKVDRKSNIVTPYNQFWGRYRMAVNREGELFIWANDGLLYAFDRSKQTFYKLSAPKLNCEDIINMYAEPGRLILFMKTGILHYHLSQREGAYQSASLESEIHQSLLYGGKSGNTSYYIDNTYRFYQQRDGEKKAAYIADWSTLIEGRGEIADILCEGKAYFIAFKTNGVLKLSPADGHTYKAEDLGIKAGIFRLLKDRFQNIIWIATDGQGVYVYSESRYSVQSVTYKDLDVNIGKPIRSIFLDDQQTLWLGTKGEGILRIEHYDPEKYTFPAAKSWLTTHNSGLADNSVYAFASGRRPLLWIGHEGGISYYSYRTRSIHSLPTPQPVKYVHAIYEESDSVLWLATVGTGVLRLTLAGNDNHLHATHVKAYTIGNGNTSYNYFYALFVDAQRKLWFGNRGYGLFGMEHDGLVSVPFKHNPENRTINDVFSILRDGDTFWLGTCYGLVRKRGNEESYFNRDTGFSNSTIHTLLQDKNQNLWITTNDGLIRFNPADNEFQNYNRASGLKVVEFSDGASFAKNNVLYFGGINGLAIVRENPSINEDTGYIPPLRFVSLNILGHDVNMTDYIHREDNDMPTLSLAADQNYFSLSLTVLDYINPTNYSYLYRLSGHDQWIDNGPGNNKLSFTRMEHGTYTLEVKYRDQMTGRTSDVYPMQIRIAAPWYLTNLALFIYVCLVCLTLATTGRYLLRQEKRKRKATYERIEREHREELYEEKLRFFTNITHEFCTPLTLIYGPCERLLNHTPSDDYVKKYATIIRDNAQHLNALIQEIIDFRRIETGHQTCVVREVNISETCTGIAHNFEALAELQQIDFTSEVQPDVIWYTDYNCFTKILNNLLSNAFKYTTPQGTVRLNLHTTPEGQLQITVYNTGKGIRKEDLAQVFDRYKMLDNMTANEEADGTFTRHGLGMAICQSMVALLKGHIEVESEEGAYAQFCVTLPPLEPTEAQHAAPAIPMPATTPNTQPPTPEEAHTPAAPEWTGKKPTILAVDDNEDILLLLQDALADRYTVQTASNADEALQKLKEETPDLIVTDIMMPGTDGIKFTKILKQNKHTLYIPVIILSAKGRNEEKVEGLGAGADAYIAKPFETSYLEAVARRLIENKHRLKDYYNSSACAYDFTHGQLVTKESKEFITSLTAYIDEHIADQDLSIEGMAEAFRLSLRSLYRRFKELELGSPKDYIKTYRIQMAAKLLRTTSLTVQEVMYRTGFANRSHFYKEFAKNFSMTPKDYRTAEKQRDNTLPG